MYINSGVGWFDDFAMGSWGCLFVRRWGLVGGKSGRSVEFVQALVVGYGGMVVGVLAISGVCFVVLIVWWG